MRSKAAAIGLPLAAGAVLTFAAPSPALADSTRTLNLSFSCATGLPYGLQVNTGSGWYTPSGSSYIAGNVKVFTVSISAGATLLQYMPGYCDNEPSGGSGPDPWWHSTSLTPGTSTITATGSCQDFTYNFGGGQPALIFDCTISSLSYG
jgi:hypothetical protein